MPEERFSSSLPILALVRQPGSVDWSELDRGPGYFTVPEGQEVGLRLFDADDASLAELIEEVREVEALTFLNLAEGRKVTDEGLRLLEALPRLTALNLSSVNLTNTGLESLRLLPHLERLDISYCNRITDLGLKSLRRLERLAFLDVQGCVKLTQGGLARLGRPGLTIHRGGRRGT